jgi:hypothetical protein
MKERLIDEILKLDRKTRPTRRYLRRFEEKTLKSILKDLKKD